MAAEPRVVVIDMENGRRARVDSDSAVPMTKQTEKSKVWEMWSMDGDGKRIDNTSPWRHDPLPGGAIYRIVTLLPSEAEGSTPQPPALHASDTVDIGIVLSGEATLLLGNGRDTRLRTHDSFVLTGADHGWRVEGDEPCVLAVVLLSADIKVDDPGA